MQNQSVSGFGLRVLIIWIRLGGGYGSAGMRPERRIRCRNDAGRCKPLPRSVHSGPKAINPGGLGACVREDLMDLLIERNRLG